MKYTTKGYIALQKDYAKRLHNHIGTFRTATNKEYWAESENLTKLDESINEYKTHLTDKQYRAYRNWKLRKLSRPAIEKEGTMASRAYNYIKNSGQEVFYWQIKSNEELYRVATDTEPEYGLEPGYSYLIGRMVAYKQIIRVKRGIYKLK